MAASEAAKEVVFMKFLTELGVITKVVDPMILYCDNIGAITQAKEPMNHKRKDKQIEMKYYLVREIVQRRDIIVENIASEDNLTDPFTKALKTKVFDSYVHNICLRCTL